MSMTPPLRQTAAPRLEDEWFDIIQKARWGLGWSLADAARAANVSFETLELWESGRGLPPPAHLAALARALGLDAAKLSAIQEGGGVPSPQPREGIGRAAGRERG